MKSRLIVILIPSLLSGCADLMAQKTAELAPSRETQGKGEVVTIPAQLRTVTNKNTVGSYVTCAEPGPDVAMSDTFKLITGITSDTSAGNKASVNNDLQTSTTALELAGRTQTVLLAREFLYRTCEAASNGWITPKNVEAAHIKILEQISGLIETDKEKAKTTAAIAGAVATGKLDPKILENTATAVNSVIRDACVTNFTSCMAAAGANAKACKSDLNDCLK